MVVVKLSSFGRKDSDQSNARYISRFNTCTDELGMHLTPRQRQQAVTERLKSVDSSKTSFRLIVSLPADLDDAEQAQAQGIINDEIRSRYGSYLSAWHSEPGKNTHVHALIFNDLEHHKLRDMGEVHELKASINASLQARGISKNIEKNNSDEAKTKETQAEAHMKEKSKQVWKDDIRTSVKNALDSAKDFNDFTAKLKASGVTISRQTANSLTFQDKEGRPVRLNRLFSKLRGKESVEKYINGRMKKMEDKEKRERESWQKLREQEEWFCKRLARTTDVLAKQGMTQTQIQSALAGISSVPNVFEKDLKARWARLKEMRGRLDKVMSKETMQNELHEQKMKARQSDALARVLSSGNVIGALITAIVLIAKEAIATYQKQQEQTQQQSDAQDRIKGIMRDDRERNEYQTQQYQRPGL